MMEKIFKQSRIAVEDNGFSENVIKHILDTMPMPSRAMYCMPTLVTALATVIVIAILKFTVGLDEINVRYDKFADAISYHNQIHYVDENSVEEYDWNLDTE